MSVSHPITDRDLEPIGPPRGQVTLMFTDIEGSTAGWERWGDLFGEALAVHNGIVRQALRCHRGYEVKTVGDAFMVAFGSAVDAVRCAIDIQAGLARNGPGSGAWDRIGGIRVRIGLHTGEPTFRDNDYFGPAVNRAARIEDAAHGGMALASEATWRLVERDLAGSVHAEDLGLHRLKDLGAPERIYSVSGPGIPPAPLLPLRTLDALPHNFPAQVSSFVGRQAELDRMAEILRVRRSRLVTLLGPGGTGKTRLAMQVAANRMSDFPDGVWVVELAGARVPDEVAPTIALALGVRLGPEQEPRRSVAEFLKPKRCLLVLDNFEQVVSAADMVAALLRDCPNLTCIVTSRELLNISGELSFEVAPLTLPPADGQGDVAWTRCEAVRLFIERAQAVRPDFVVTDETGPVVGEICRRLDGIPLAIELAAARVRGLSPQQIRQRLARRFDLLIAGRRDVPERQRALRSAIDWSYDLLLEDERRMFAELAVFAGGFTVEAAEEVCATPGAFDLVFSLRDKSLVRTIAHGDHVRYSMLESIRAYASERLAAQGEAREVHARHAAWALEVAEEWNAKIAAGGPEAPDGMRVFTEELDNIRAAMDWCWTEGDWGRTAAFGKAISRFLLTRGLYGECEARLGNAIEASRRGSDPRTLARLLNQRGLVAWQRSEIEVARPLFAESYEISRDLGDRDRMIVSLINLGNLAWARSEFTDARRVWEEALEIAVETGASSYRAYLGDDLGILATERGDLELARSYFAESLKLHRESGSQEGVAFSLYNSASVSRKRGELDEARVLVEESRRIFQSLDHKRGQALTAVRLGLILLETGRPTDGCAQAELGLSIARETGDRHCEAYALATLARATGLSGQSRKSLALFAEALEKTARLGDRKHLAETARDAADAAVAAGHAVVGLTLAVLAAREFDALGLGDREQVAAHADEIALGMDPAAVAGACERAALLDGPGAVDLLARLR